MDNFFDPELAVRLLGLGFVRTALLAGAVLGVLAGVLGPLIVMRRMAFAVHGTAELAFTGAAAALLLGSVSPTGPSPARSSRRCYWACSAGGTRNVTR